MNTLRKLYKNNQTSFYFLFAVFLVGVVFYLLIQKGDAVYWFHAYRAPFLDVFFLMVTQLAEPFVISVCCLVLLFLNWRKGVFLLVCILANTALVQFLKRMVFNAFKRPAYALGKELDVVAGGDLEVIEGVRLSIDHSFPSGHTMAGTTIFFILSLLVKQKASKLALICCVPLVAISRVYLAQHYLMDVLAGGAFAVILCVIYYILYNQSKLKFA